MQEVTSNSCLILSNPVHRHCAAKKMLSKADSLAILTASRSDYDQDPAVKGLMLAMGEFGYLITSVGIIRLFRLLAADRCLCRPISCR